MVMELMVMELDPSIMMLMSDNPSLLIFKCFNGDVVIVENSNSAHY